MPVTTTAPPSCVGEYAEHCRAKKLSDRYVTQVETLLARFFAHAGDSDPATIEPADIEAWLEFRSNVEHCSGKTHNNEKAALSAFFHWARKTERCRVNPCLDVQSATAAPRIEYDYLTVEEVRRLLAVSLADEAKPLAERRSDHNRSRIYRVAYATGLRAGSLRAARVGDFMDGKAQPTLKIRAIKHKTRKPHEVPLTAEGVEVFRELCAGRDHRDLLFERFPHARVIRADFREAGIRGPGGLQRFRVTVCTLMAEAGVPIEAAQAMLGHSSPETTKKHYDRSKKIILASQVANMPRLTRDQGGRTANFYSSTLDKVTGSDDTSPVAEVEPAMNTIHEQIDRGTGRDIPEPGSLCDTKGIAGRDSRPVPGRSVPATEGPSESGWQDLNLRPAPRGKAVSASSCTDPDDSPTRQYLILADRATQGAVAAERIGRSDLVRRWVSIAKAAMDALGVRMARRAQSPTP
jgi:integrase